jgi:hypothetical protein
MIHLRFGFPDRSLGNARRRRGLSTTARNLCCNQ